jgi:chromosome segregation ATPase
MVESNEIEQLKSSISNLMTVLNTIVNDIESIKIKVDEFDDKFFKSEIEISNIKSSLNDMNRIYKKIDNVSEITDRFRLM